MGFDISMATGGSIGVTFRPADGTLELWGTGSACFQMCSYGSINVPDPTTQTHEVRLKLMRESATELLATVYLDGAATAWTEVEISIDPGSSPFNEVGFAGSIGGSLGAPYPPGTHRVDNFEATYTCLTCASATGDEPGPVEGEESEGT